MNFNTLLIICVLFITLFTHVPALAEEEARLITMNSSTHFDDGEYNETHNGIGIEYTPTGDWGDYTGILTFKNSEWNQSIAAYYGREFEVGSITNLSYGYQFGVVTGYSWAPVSPFGLLYGQYGTDRLQGRLTCVPPIVCAVGIVWNF